MDSLLRLVDSCLSVLRHILVSPLSGFNSATLPLFLELSPSCPTHLSIPHATLISSHFYRSGETIPLPHTVPSCRINKTTASTDLCRLALSVSTSQTSTVFIEAWLPRHSIWNGRLLASGTGGIGGCVDYDVLKLGTQQGFATFGMNSGHNGSSGFDFFLDRPEVLEDFGHRAAHVEALTGKQLVESFYGKPPSKNYWMGCSTGGRQGFKTASMYPSDFDGMLIGAPGVDWLRVVSSKAILASRIGWPNTSSHGYLSAKQWEAVVAEQISQCDGIDGVIDGILDDPSKCPFDPATLDCESSTTDTSLCLDSHQIESVRQAYVPILDSTGKVVYPSFAYGAETKRFSNYPKSYTILSDFFRGAIHNSTTWSAMNFTAATMDQALSIDPGGVNTDAASLDLRGFSSRGGKILSYHGRADESLTSTNSQKLFDSIQKQEKRTLDEMHDFYRLFFIPGMKHCHGGVGQWDIGQAAPGVGLPDLRMLDAKQNALVELVKWVEDGEAPWELIGAKFPEDDRSELEKMVSQRTHCVYPNVSISHDEEDFQDRSRWHCHRP